MNLELMKEKGIMRVSQINQKNSLMLTISLIASLSIGLYSQFFHLFIYNDFNTMPLRLGLAIPVSLMTGILYFYIVKKIFFFLFTKNPGYKILYRNYFFCHAPFIILLLYPFQFAIENTDLSRYLLAVALLAFLFLVSSLFIFPLFRQLIPSGMMSTGKWKTLYTPLWMVLFLVAYFCIWHLCIAYIFLDMKNFERDIVRGPVSALLAIYCGVSVLITLFIYAVTYINRRALNIILYAVLSLAALISIWTRGLDFGTFFYSGARVDSVIWDHFFNRENLMFMLTPVALAGFAVVVFLIYVFIVLIRKSFIFFISLKEHAASEREGRSLMLISAGISVCSITVLYFIFFSLFYLSRPLYPKEYDAASYIKIPEIHVLSSMYDYYIGTDEFIDRLPAELSQKCSDAGWVLNSVTEEYPLYKKSIYTDLKDENAAKPVLKPGSNIIIVFAESFSKYFTDEKMHGQKGLTPNIDDMKKHGITFENMFNIIAPTITGIIASMGAFPYYVEKYNITQGNHLTNVRFSFLTEILKKHGYYTVHYQGSTSDFASAETIFKAHGYDDFISLENDDLRNYAVLPKSNWGLRDSDLFSYIVHSMKDKKVREPFVMTVSTIDLHPPYKINGGIKHFSDPIFDCVYSTDMAFGIFWEYFKKSPYYGNTAVLFIADHAMVMNTKYFKLRGESFDRSRQDLITSVLYVPDNREWRNRKISTSCTNLDIAPTFCEMLGIDSANSFLGMPVFSERPYYPYMPGEGFIDGVYNSENRSRRKILFTLEEHVKIYSFIKGLSIKNRIYPRAE